MFGQSHESHKHVRHLTLQMLGTQGLRLRLIQDIDLLARQQIAIGAKNGCLDIKEAGSKLWEKWNPRPQKNSNSVGEASLEAGSDSSLVHFNGEKYEDPFKFNPWRWKGKDLNATISKTFMPFGIGTRLCAGSEFAKMQITFFIHHLSSRYRWSMDDDVKVLRQYVLLFPKGSNVRITGRYEPE
ncbi:unnamed protein product [Microthlaspi erraticum]|uniref:Cytochrome P450 n=1 Tax=Microthlaspi erraticum TaxID=1685480 RepID=A0A6D2HMN0_9BRAS|nr:unnamed protein product [Microthlaspi erraticum]